MDPKTRQHDIVRVGLVIDAVPPGKRAAGSTRPSMVASTRPSMVAAPAHQRNQKRPRTSSNAVPEPLSKTFRSLLIGFINRFGGVSVVTEGSFGVHDSGEKDMRFTA